MAHEDATNVDSKAASEAQKKGRTSSRGRRGQAANVEPPVEFPGDPRRALSAAANDDEPTVTRRC